MDNEKKIYAYIFLLGESMPLLPLSFIKKNIYTALLWLITNIIIISHIRDIKKEDKNKKLDKLK